MTDLNKIISVISSNINGLDSIVKNQILLDRIVKTPTICDL